MEFLFYGLLGLIIGSFLNVLILRHGVRALGGRSACMSCGREIAWFDLIPVWSWIALRGRCRHCHTRISLQYPLVEGATALLFVAIGVSPIALSLKMLALPVAALFVAIAVYDLYYTIIPDAWAYTCAVLSLAAMVVALQGSGDPYTFAVAFFAGPLAASPLAALWLVSGGRWMGLGDAKLALSIGWLLGPFSGVGAVFFAFILGAVVSVPLLALSSPSCRRVISGFTRTLTLASLRSVFGQPPSTFAHQKTMPKLVFGFTMQSEVPFGPFLIASCFFLWILQLYGIPIPLVTFL